MSAPAQMSPGAAGAVVSTSPGESPRQTATPKNVSFELLFPNSPQYRARLSMRVQIYPHDTTESIVTTVKNFYGVYSGPGVSFEDEHGNTLIARYENFQNHMVVYVRVVEEAAAPAAPVAGSPHRHPYYAGDGYPAPAQYGQEVARPESRTSRKRSPSPGTAGRGRRSASASTSGKKSRSRSLKNGPSATQAGGDSYSESLNGYSSGDNAPGSSSSKIKEHLGNTEISVENIVEGGRRKRAKFESSELPLFAPPQMPASTSNPSVSPARRIDHHSRPSLPSAVALGQNPFTNSRPLQSPHIFANGTGLGLSNATASDARRNRGSVGGYGGAAPPGVLPTPDPTIGSCVSEEDKDVAIQLMRLGEMSNMSHGRTSASTLDETFSGRADAASSTGATSDGESESEDEMPPARRQKLDTAGTSHKIYPTTERYDGSGDEVDFESGAADARGDDASKNKTLVKNILPGALMQKPKVPKAKAPRPAIMKAKKPLAAAAAAAGPMSPPSVPPSRKPSLTSMTPMGPPVLDDDHLDLSSKPRCQRCRKSKKGCDRQRPCGRCRDAGIPADQCISEDEGNGRKGRYGRHMGVPIKKEEVMNTHTTATLLPAAPIVDGSVAIQMAGLDKSKKRKR